MSEFRSSLPSTLTIVFEGDPLDVVATPDGDHWVVLARLCEPLGIDPDGQRRKLLKLPWATTKIILAVASDGRTREVFCLHLRSVAGWLFTLNASKIAPHLREKVVRYQCDCAEVLAEHVLGPRGCDEELAIKHAEAEAEVRRAMAELHAPNNSAIIGAERAERLILANLREAARIHCATIEDTSGTTFHRERLDREEQVRLHVGFPRSLAQSWANLPILDFGRAMGKVLEILARDRRGARRRKRQLKLI